MAKKAKSDRISSLPVPLLSHILSFLPCKDAVRTSVLSPRWRYLYTSMSTFDFRSGVNYNPNNNFKYFVDRLFFYPNPISLECFRVNDNWVELDSPKDDYLHIYGWICAALWRGVKEIDLWLKLDGGFELPTFLFTSRSLVTLKLHFERPVNVPSEISLPNLNTLHLSYLNFRGFGSFHSFIYSLHVLEDLVIKTCGFDEDTIEFHIHNLSIKRLVLDFGELDDVYDPVFVINAPSLVYFQYIGLVTNGYTLRNMDSLEKARIDLHGDFLDRERSVIQLLQGICNVRSLCLAAPDSYDTLPRMLLDEQVAFHNLVELTFSGGDHFDDWKGAWLVEFLQCVPNLNKLIMTLAVPEKGFRDLPQGVPSCLLFHLKEITIEDYKEDTHMLELISYFLSNAVVLEKLILRKGNLSEENQLHILDNLLSLPKKSKKCQVLIC